MLSMIKKGKTRLPLERVPALAKALEIDPAVLFRVALKELWPGYHKVVASIFRDVLSEEEWRIIELIRDMVDKEVAYRLPPHRRATPEGVRASRMVRKALDRDGG